MSRSSLPVVRTLLALALLPLLLCLVSSTSAAAVDTGTCNLRTCATMDLALLQEYVSNLNVSSESSEVDLPVASTITQPPFGALASDWSRLLLLLENQPEGTELRENLMRLSRIILVSFFESTESPEWTLNGTIDSATKRTSVSEISELTTIPETALPADQQVANVTAISLAWTAAETIDGDLGRDYSPLPNETSTNESETTWTPTYNDEDSVTWSTPPSRETERTEAPDVEDSRTNEAVHERSREEFVQASHRAKKSDRRLVDEFFASEPRSATGATFLQSDEFLTSAEVQEFFSESESAEGNSTSASVERFFEEAEREGNGTSEEPPTSFFNGTNLESANGTVDPYGIRVTDTSLESITSSISSQELVDAFFADDEMSLASTETHTNESSTPATQTDRFFSSEEPQTNGTTDQTTVSFGETTEQNFEEEGTTNVLSKEGFASVSTSTHQPRSVFDRFGFSSNENESTTSRPEDEEGGSTVGPSALNLESRRSKRRIRARDIAQRLRRRSDVEAARRFRVFLGLESPRPLAVRRAKEAVAAARS